MKRFIPYTGLIVLLFFISFLSYSLLSNNPNLYHDHNLPVFVIGTIFFVGYLLNRIAPKTLIPSFVWAIFAGFAMQPILGIFTNNLEPLQLVMEVFGAIILFAGGLEVPFKNFKKWFLPILSLSFLGLVISTLLFTGILTGFTTLIGTFSSALLPSIAILAAALASTDPSAIIPTLKSLTFKRPFLREFAISESALSDVSGSILTRFLLIAIISTPITLGSSVLSPFLPLLQKATYDALALQILSGILVGYLGYILVKHFYYKKDGAKSDPALLIAVPFFTFVLGNLLGGAGLLASFTAGLLVDHEGGMKKVIPFYDSLLDHLIKPFIFIILGGLVPLATIIGYAPVGIITAILFIVVIRPLSVFVSLAPWVYTHKLKFNELLFLSLIRETGIIAAILLIIAATHSVIESTFVIAVGMWVILLTLMIEPPLTPWLAKKIGVTKPATRKKKT